MDRDRLPAGVAHKPDYPGHQKAGSAGPGGWERCVWVVGGVLKRQGYNSSICAIHLWPLPASYIFLSLFSCWINIVNAHLFYINTYKHM